MMTDLETYRPPDRNPAALTFANVPQALELAEKIASTAFVPSDLRGKPEAVLAAMLTGAELGLPPMASLSKIHVVDGRPAIAAELMRAIVLRAGHELWLESASNTSVTMGGRRAGQKQATRIVWTMDDARTAGLERKNNWRNYPRAMLTARATGELCRILFADVLSGISYTREELADGFVLEDDAISEAPDPTLLDRPADVEPAEPPKTTRKAAGPPPPIAPDRPTETAETPKTGNGRRAPDPAPPAPPPPLPGEAGIPATVPPDAPTADHVHGDTIPGQTGASYTPAQALAIRAREVGLSEDERRGVYAAVTSGRARSGKDLDRDEISAVFEILDQVNERTAEIVEREPGRWTVDLTDGGSTVFDSGPVKAPIVDPDDVPSFLDPGDAQSLSEPLDVGSTEVPADAENAQTGPDEAPESSESANPADEAAWKAYLRSHGAKIADALRAAAALAGDPKAAPTLGALAADRDLSGRVAAYIAEEAST